MIRYGFGILLAGGACIAGVAACGDDIAPPPATTGTGGAAGAGGGAMGTGAVTGNGGSTAGTGGGGQVTGGCTAACCPTNAACYSDPAKGQQSEGAECLAKRVNDPNGRIQMRQTWIHPTSPIGNTLPVVYGALNTFTTLPWTDCSMSGSGGYVQLIDLDLAKGESSLGFARSVQKEGIQAALTDGLCMADDTWTDNPKYLTADQMSSSAGWPTGLTPPMAGKVTPWHFGPTKSKRLDADFKLTDPGTGFPTKREEFLATVGTGALSGYGGVFSYINGVSHGYGKMGWLLIYDPDPKAYIAVPIREPEVTITSNDKDHPDCVGVFNADKLDQSTGCAVDNTSSDKTAWGCPNGSCPVGQGPAKIEGYFLITELEQIYSSVLQQTLCVSYAADEMKKQGFFDQATGSCHTAKWNPSQPGGLPQGDWCAKDNKPAHDGCADAWHSVSYHTFSSFPIKDGTCKAE